MDPALQLQLLDFLDQEEEVEAIMSLRHANRITKKVRVISRLGNVITCRIKRGDIQEVYASPLKVSLKASRIVQVAPSIREEEIVESIPTESVWAKRRRKGKSLPTGKNIVL